VSNEQKSPRNVGEILKAYLRENGYDGLCNPNIECECDFDDFAPCTDNPMYGGISTECQPAHRREVEPGIWRCVIEDGSKKVDIVRSIDLVDT